MGGIVGRLALQIDVAHLVDFLLTMSTPHQIPPVTFEYDMEAIYRYISRPHNASMPLLISLCGGVSDTQIASDSCSLSADLITSNDGFAVFTSGMPGVWTGVDHQAMVWCHQVRWRVARALLETTRKTERVGKLKTAKRWLLGHEEEASSFSTTLVNDVTLPVNSKDMTAILRSAMYPTDDRIPDIRIEYCGTTNHCIEIQAEVESIPYPSDAALPFPLPGEGIKPGEVAFVMDMQLPSSAGFLRIRSAQPVNVELGAHRAHHAAMRTWSEPSSSINDTKILKVPMVQSTLRISKSPSKELGRPRLLCID